MISSILHKSQPVIQNYLKTVVIKPSYIKRCLSTSNHNVKIKRLNSNRITQRVSRPHTLSPFNNSRYVHANSTSKPVPFTFIPHQFGFEEACKRFIEEDKDRLFAPSKPEWSKALAIQGSVKEPLKKVFIPYFYVNAETIKTEFNGEFGITRTYVIHTKKGPIYSTYTDWYPLSGTLGPRIYEPENDDLFVYGGLTWSSRLVEKAVSGFDIIRHLKPFDPKLIDSMTTVDPFLKRSAIAQDTALTRIKSFERERIKGEIRRRSGRLKVSVNYMDIQYKNVKIQGCLLPVYILKYNKNTPPRVLPAINIRKTKITGPVKLSPSKCMVGSAVVSTVAVIGCSILFPEVSLQAELLMIPLSVALTGLWAQHHLKIRSIYQGWELKRERELNASVSETKADRERREATEEFSSSNQIVELVSKHFYALGLDPEEPITNKKIQDAFADKIKKCHPDITKGNSDKAIEIIEARNAFLKAFGRRRTKRKGEVNSGKRFYSTQSKSKIKEPPRSLFHRRARELINAVIQEKNYTKALRLVEKDEIHPDAHDQNENTLLTEAAKVGDLEAIRFAIVDLNASPDTSCDCPAHRTPLHYASEKGHVNAVKLLLKF